MARTSKVVFITGCSSGFGYHAAMELAGRGHRVFASMREMDGRNAPRRDELLGFAREGGGFLNVIECDVNDTGSVDTAVTSVVDAAGHVDVLVNNAGYGIYGPVECFDEQATWDAFNTNVMGYIRAIRAVLPGMRERRSGHVINVSSVLGKLGLPVMGFYNAAKFAVEGLSEALLGEAYLFNIKVSVVNPHMFATDFAGRSMKLVCQPENSGEYQKAFTTLLDKQSNLINPKSGPGEVGKKIAWLVSKKNPPFRVPAGKNARRDMFFARWMPPLLLQKIAAKLYGMGDVFTPA